MTVNNLWVQVSDIGPSARSGHKMVYDSDRNVTVLFGGIANSICLNDTWEWDGTVWTQVSDLKGWNNEAAAKYNIQSIPQNFLIDPAGKIISKNLRGEDLDSRLNELLGAK